MDYINHIEYKRYIDWQIFTIGQKKIAPINIDDNQS